MAWPPPCGPNLGRAAGSFPADAPLELLTLLLHLGDQFPHLVHVLLLIGFFQVVEPRSQGSARRHPAPPGRARLGQQQAGRYQRNGEYATQYHLLRHRLLLSESGFHNAARSSILPIPTASGDFVRDRMGSELNLVFRTVHLSQSGLHQRCSFCRVDSANRFGANATREVSSGLPLARRPDTPAANATHVVVNADLVGLRAQPVRPA